MKIGILGTCNIGRTLAETLSVAGHEVKVANSPGPDTIEAELLTGGAFAVMLERDPATARAAGRKQFAIYLKLGNYQKNWASLGFDESDWAGGGSDRLIDAMFAWRSEDAIRNRLQQHFDGGSDQVCIQPVAPSGEHAQDLAVLKALGPGA